MTLRKASLWALAALTMALGSCRKVDADISSTSVLNASANRTAMDEYIEREVTSPYNIQIYYRYTESEIGRNWVTSPPTSTTASSSSTSSSTSSSSPIPR